MLSWKCFCHVLMLFPVPTYHRCADLAAQSRSRSSSASTPSSHSMSLHVSCRPPPQETVLNMDPE
uniref:Secreted protein n=1 Tax=Timema tahoe TaxID=61484 RepID=A0A7R9IGU6_9NEOP|nr:unnamed protein product [Timema tahoe]